LKRKRVNWHNIQEVCPFSLKFAEEAAEPGYAARGPGERPVGVEAVPEEGDSVSIDATVTDSAESRGRSDGDAGRAPIHPGTDGPPLIDLLRTALSEDAWEAFSRASAIRRAGFARNVCVAIGNCLSGEAEPPPEAVRVLAEALSDAAPLVRGHGAWALGRISSAAARSALERRASVEEDLWVRSEIISALEESRPART